MTTIIQALLTIWQSGGYRWLSIISFILFLLLYLFTLPSTFTGGRPGLMALQYLDAAMIILSLIMAFLVALIVTTIIWLLRRGQQTSKSSATGGVLLGLLTPLLCCSPIIPIIFAALASFLPAFISLPGPIFQGFIATHQMELFILAILLMAAALYQNAVRVINSADNCRLCSSE